jgi:hypothetical protein
MKKTILTLALLGSALLNAQNYIAEGVATKDSKNDACSTALVNAKSNALEEAGTLVFSNFNSSTSDDNGKISKVNQSKLSTAALGITKLKSKHEDVKVSQDYKFTCKVKATFEIDADEMKASLLEMMKKQADEAKLAGYFQADGYSEEGQSRYKAYSAAKLLAQRNLLEVIKGADITSLTKMDSGVIEADKIGKLISGTLAGAEVVKKEYNEKTKSAHIVLRIKKATIAKAFEEN